MEHIDLVEKLREKTGVSYGEAKEALERTNWDILDAIVYLEAQGKVGAGSTGSYSTKREAPEEAPKVQEQPAGDGFKEFMQKFWAWLKKVFHAGNINHFKTYRKSEETLSIPVTLFVLLLLFAFWIVLPLMIIGLFFGCRYAFTGPDLGKESVNHAMGKATDVAESIKAEFADKSKQN
jgi:hypothetical protein